MENSTEYTAAYGCGDTEGTVDFEYSIQYIGAQDVTITAPAGTPAPKTVEEVYELMDRPGVEVYHGDTEACDCEDNWGSPRLMFDQRSQDFLGYADPAASGQYAVLQLSGPAPDETAKLHPTKDFAVAYANAIIERAGFDPATDGRGRRFSWGDSHVYENGDLRVAVIKVEK